MNRRPLAPAPSTVINVASTSLRSQSRTASHRGSGGYTEMRAQIRKEREHESQQRSHAQPAPLRDVETQPRKQASVNTHSQTHLSASISNQKISHFSTSEDDAIDNQLSTDKKSYPRVLPASGSGINADNSVNMSATSSQISSSSSTGVVKKRSQTVSTQEPQLQQQQPSQPPASTSQIAIRDSHQHLYQHQHQHEHQHEHQQPDRIPQSSITSASRAESYSDIPSPPTSPEQRIGVDTMHAAFSAKYYELAVKCRGWETFAAKLRAQIGALEAEHRVLKEHNALLEAENAKLHVYLHREEKTRTQLQGRMSSLEDCLSQRPFPGSNLGSPYQALDMRDYDHLSVPSAPSSVERANQVTASFGHTPYCSSNLQVEDRSELRPQAMPSLPINAGVLQTTTVTQHLNVDSEKRQAIAMQARELEALHSKWDSSRPLEDVAYSPEDVQYAAYAAAANAEGRSSRLATHTDVPSSHIAHKRSGTVGAIGMFAPRSGSVLGVQRGHLLSSQTQAQSQQESASGVARPASAQRFNGTVLENNVSTTAASIVAGSGVAKAALQSKRRSTVSGDRGPSLSLAQIVKGALTASGVVATASSQSQSRQTSPSDKALTSSDYLQGCLEKRREAMRSTFTAQQKGTTPAGGQAGGASRPVSRAASRLSTQSGTRSRSRAGSVHDAIPLAIEDVFCNPKTVKAHSRDTSPELPTQQLAAASLTSHTDISVASQRLMAVTDTHYQAAQPTSRQELSSAFSSPGSFMPASTATYQDQDEGEDEHLSYMSFERKLYIRIQEELDDEDFAKFERCIQRYDFLDIPLEGSKGLITRVKRLLLVSSPDLRTQPDKLRVRQSLARDFEKMALQFSQAKKAQSAAASQEFQ
ncbi:hypothetical protein PHSY_004460 [Pseudozyma hubeiensis SY62]|uniref:Uncharacterized protein n=1 Tax=Pseudozyma hubeiensis (strain SY62) TaxID=1305764 RepID=R9P6A3_PSEHS|nr:hypothetical protein PHSY_004460 [Pseudozyma hubeiensis SY62]GAC96876.1 hypothetical protein PHSY_004460 [Pseudozyma hubeiensis SY62]